MSANRRSIFCAGAIILLATWAAYHNSLSGPLVLDDSSAVTNNPSIRRLWPLGPVLAPPAECTVAGRPLANLSFALNYAMGGTAVEGYHALNLLLHSASALLLFGLIRRVLLLPGPGETPALEWLQRLGEGSLVFPVSAATLWAVHPLLTAAVSYISQRTELMMGFFYLLVVYSFVRGVERGRRAWYAVSVAAGWFGMMSKEGMVTAPALVLLLDASFVAGSFTEALRQRWRYYLALASSWVLLGFLLSGLQHRSVGFDLGVSWWRYALTECQAVLLYLRLIIWPDPLIFDYGAIFLENGPAAAAFAVLMAIFVGGAVWAFRRWPRIGFLPVAFLIILSPTSSVVPISAQPIAENRLYLASVPMIVLGALALFSWLGRRGAWVALVIAGVLGWLSTQRNEVLQSGVALWNDTVAKRPANPRAFANLGEVLFAAGDVSGARRQFELAVRLKPDFPEVQNNLGTCLQMLGDGPQALVHFEEAVRLKPDFASAHNNLGNALLQSGRIEEARRHLEAALRLFADEHRLKLELPDTHNNLGNALLYQGHGAEALAQYEAALGLRPDFVQARMNLGAALRQLGRVKEAASAFEQALRLKEDFPEAHANLGFALAELGDFPQAQSHFEAAVRFKPDFVQARQALGDLLLSQGKRAEARMQYEAALQIRPNDPGLQQRLKQAADAAK